MSNGLERFTPNPVNHEHGENGCCKNPRAWEMEMMHQVWAAGLHDAANCFQNALEAKWNLESQRKVKPKTNGDRIRAVTDEILAEYLTHKKRLASMEAERNKIMTNGDKVRAMTDEELAGLCGGLIICPPDVKKCCDDCRKCWLDWLRSPVEESEK